MKKLIIINSILLVLVLAIFIIGYYFINYPEDFNLIRVIKDAEWKAFSLIILAIFICSVVFAFLPLKKHRFGNRFLTISGGLSLLFLSFLILKGLDSFFKNKRVFDQLVSGYREKAEKDIKSGLITIEYGGGFIMPPDEKTQKMNKEIDSLNRVFGLTYMNSGCMINAALIKAQQEYIKYTKPYLNKRNGPDWELRMKKQTQKIQNNYR